MPPILARERLWDDGDMTPIVFRPWTGIAVTVLVGAVVVVSLSGLVIAGDGLSLRRFGAAFVALAFATWVLFWWPAVIVTPETVTVRNPLRTFVVPWGNIESVETRFGMRLLLRPDGAVSAWGAPAESRRASARLLQRARATASAGATDALSREAREVGAGEAATYIRRELPKRSSAPGEVARRVNVPIVVALAAVVIAAVVFSLT